MENLRNNYGETVERLIEHIQFGVNPIKYQREDELIKAIKVGCKFRTLVAIDDDSEDVFGEVFVKNNSLYTINENGLEVPLDRYMLSYIDIVESKGLESSIYHVQFEHIDRSYFEPLASTEIKKVIALLENIARKLWSNGCYSCIKIQGVYDSILNASTFSKENIGLISIGWGGECTSDESYIEYYPEYDKFEMRGIDFGRGSSISKEISGIADFCNKNNIVIDEEIQHWF